MTSTTITHQSWCTDHQQWDNGPGHTLEVCTHQAAAGGVAVNDDEQRVDVAVERAAGDPDWQPINVQTTSHTLDLSAQQARELAALLVAAAEVVEAGEQR